MNNSQKNVPCSCCKNLTLPQANRYEICPVCFWESDPMQNNDENYIGGANTVSLAQARLNYQKFGSVTNEAKNYVRSRLAAEIPNEDPV
jgi:Cysteine-rich CPCC